jgi:hypothetical protein
MNTFPSAAPYVARLLASSANDDAVGIRTALADARAVGLNAEMILIYVIGAFGDLLQTEGIDVETEAPALLLSLAAEEAGDA